MSTVNLTPREHAFYEAGKLQGRVEASREIVQRLAAAGKHYTTEAAKLPTRKARLVAPWLAGYQSFADQIAKHTDGLQAQARAALTKAVDLEQPATKKPKLRNRLTRAIMDFVDDS